MFHKFFRWFASLFLALALSLSGFTPALAAPPANDNFANAEAITSLPFSTIVDITDATIEVDEQTFCSFTPQTVWYSFTAGANGVVRAEIQTNTSNAVLTVYQAVGPGFGGLNPLTCGVSGNSITFNVQAGMNYYIQAGHINGGAGTLSLDLQEIPAPPSDNFASAEVIGPLPFIVSADSSGATFEMDEPMPSCGNNSIGRTIWYAFTPTTSGSFTANVLSASFSPVIAAYTGSSLDSLTEVGCSTFGAFLLTFQANAGTTYYIQVGGFFGDGSPFQFDFEVAPLPLADMCFAPTNPSTFDTVQFNDCSYDPGGVDFQSFGWDFGDGGTATEQAPTHHYVKDGDYTVQHSVTTVDGRTGFVSRVFQIRTHDVSVSKVSAPRFAKVGQTRSITVSIRNTRYPETVTIELYRSIAGGGFELIDSSTQFVAVRKGNSTTQFNFKYTFTPQDAQAGKVTFKAVVIIETADDAFPADNETISTPPTRVRR